MWGIWCVRSPSSRLGYGEGWARDDNTKSGHREFANEADAAKQVKAWNEQVTSGAVTYFVKEFPK